MNITESVRRDILTGRKPDKDFIFEIAAAVLKTARISGVELVFTKEKLDCIGKMTFDPLQIILLEHALEYFKAGPFAALIAHEAGHILKNYSIYNSGGNQIMHASHRLLGGYDDSEIMNIFMQKQQGINSELAAKQLTALKNVYLRNIEKMADKTAFRLIRRLLRGNEMARDFTVEFLVRQEEVLDILLEKGHIVPSEDTSDRFLESPYPTTEERIAEINKAAAKNSYPRKGAFRLREQIKKDSEGFSGLSAFVPFVPILLTGMADNREVPPGKTYSELRESNKTLEALLRICLTCVAFNVETGERRLVHVDPLEHIATTQNLHKLYKIKQEEKKGLRGPITVLEFHSLITLPRIRYLSKLLRGIRGSGWCISIVSSTRVCEILFNYEEAISAGDIWYYLIQQGKISKENIRKPIETGQWVIVTIDKKGEVVVRAKSNLEVIETFNLACVVPFAPVAGRLSDLNSRGGPRHQHFSQQNSLLCMVLPFMPLAGMMQGFGDKIEYAWGAELDGEKREQVIRTIAAWNSEKGVYPHKVAGMLRGHPALFDLFVFVFVNGNILGFCNYILREASKVFKLDQVYVEKNFRRLGFYRKMTMMAIDRHLNDFSDEYSLEPPTFNNFDAQKYLHLDEIKGYSHGPMTVEQEKEWLAILKRCEYIPRISRKKLQQLDLADIKLFVFDFDDTLVAYRKHISPETLNELYALLKAGCHIAINSGRSMERIGAIPGIKELLVDHIEKDMRIRYRKQMHFLAEAGGSIWYFDKEGKLKRDKKKSTALDDDLQTKIKAHIAEILVERGLVSCFEEGHIKLVERDSEISLFFVEYKYRHHMKDIVEELQRRLAEDDVYIEYSSIALDLTTCNKAISLEKLIGELKISKDEIMAFGDSRNDFSMLSVEGINTVFAGKPGILTDFLKDKVIRVNGPEGVREVLAYANQCKWLDAQLSKLSKLGHEFKNYLLDGQKSIQSIYDKCKNAMPSDIAKKLNSSNRHTSKISQDYTSARSELPGILFEDGFSSQARESICKIISILQDLKSSYLEFYCLAIDIVDRHKDLLKGSDGTDLEEDFIRASTISQLISEIVDKYVFEIRSEPKLLNVSKFFNAYYAKYFDVHLGKMNKKDILIEAIDPNLWVNAVQLDLIEALNNLIGNAIEHGEAKKIKINIVRGNERIAIAIKDNGKGIAPELIDETKKIPLGGTSPIKDIPVLPLFACGKTTREGEGGLGLAIAYEDIVGYNNGKITVASRPGETVFTVYLPATEIRGPPNSNNNPSDNQNPDQFFSFIVPGIFTAGTVSSRENRIEIGETETGTVPDSIPGLSPRNVRGDRPKRKSGTVPLQRNSAQLFSFVVPVIQILAMADDEKPSDAEEKADIPTLKIKRYIETLNKTPELGKHLLFYLEALGLVPKPLYYYRSTLDKEPSYKIEKATATLVENDGPPGYGKRGSLWHIYWRNVSDIFLLMIDKIETLFIGGMVVFLVILWSTTVQSTVVNNGRNIFIMSSLVNLAVMVEQNIILFSMVAWVNLGLCLIAAAALILFKMHVIESLRYVFFEINRRNKDTNKDTQTDEESKKSLLERFVDFITRLWARLLAWLKKIFGRMKELATYFIDMIKGTVINTDKPVIADKHGISLPENNSVPKNISEVDISVSNIASSLFVRGKIERINKNAKQHNLQRILFASAI